MPVKARDTASSPETAPPLQRALRQFLEFAHLEASGGVLLLLCTIIALAWANSPWAESYTRLWQTKLTIGLGGFVLSKPLLLWINDGLMAAFFFVVGLEIKREMLVGELASLRKAALPIAAALGGMAFPALIYLLFNGGQEGARGWGVPMATDIAFALGVLALLGDRVPVSVKVFLTALAIVDDIGAVVAIAIFYTAQISWASLAIGAGFFLALLTANQLGARNPTIYSLLGIGLWFAFLKSGVHATIAGVLLAMTIPARARCDTDHFLASGRASLDEFGRAGRSGEDELLNEEHQAALQSLETACKHVQTPVQRLEHALHPWVTFAIMPVFALANAGVSLGGELGAALTNPVSLGVIVGLVLGKQLGITLSAWLSVRLGLAALPAGVTWRHIYGVSCVAGIGFTMSLFIAGLAFGETPLLTAAKVGILTASLVAGAAGWLILRGGAQEAR